MKTFGFNSTGTLSTAVLAILAAGTDPDKGQETIEEENETPTPMVPFMKKSASAATMGKGS